MSGKLRVTKTTYTPRDPMEVKAYCEGRSAAAAGAPAQTYGSHKSGIVANNNAIVWTAKSAGQGIKVGILAGGAEVLDRALSVSVDGLNIVVSPATDGAGDITSTAAEVMAAVSANPAANKLVSTANDGASDGTGVVVAMYPPRELTGSNVQSPAGNPLTQMWRLGFNSWAADPAGTGRDCCAAPYGGGHA